MLNKSQVMVSEAAKDVEIFSETSLWEFIFLSHFSELFVASVLLPMESREQEAESGEHSV